MSAERPTARSRGSNEGNLKNDVEHERHHRITSMTGFRLLTTLQYVFLDRHNVHVNSASRNHYELEDLVKQWRELNTELLKLHRRRLREAAKALGWFDVAAHLRPVDPVLRNGERHIRRTNSAPSIPDLQSLIEEAAKKKFPDPSAGDSLSEAGTPSVRTRILVSRSSEVTVEFGPLLDIPSCDLRQLLKMHLACPFKYQISGRIPSQVSLAAHPTIPSFFTRHKSTHRTDYNVARESAQPPVQPTDLPTAREALLFNPDDQIMEASLSAVYFHRDGKWVTPSNECGGMQSVTKIYALKKGWCNEGIVRKGSLCDGEFIWLSNAVRGFFLGRIVLNAP